MNTLLSTRINNTSTMLLTWRSSLIPRMNVTFGVLYYYNKKKCTLLAQHNEWLIAERDFIPDVINLHGGVSDLKIYTPPFPPAYVVKAG